MYKYLNLYRCVCGHEWKDTWDCVCNDRCPMCNTEIEPYESEDCAAPKLFIVVTEIVNTGTNFFPYSTEELAQKNVGRLLKQWMRPDSGIKCDEAARQEVTCLINRGNVQEAIDYWNDYQNEDCSPQAEMVIHNVVLDQTVN